MDKEQKIKNQDKFMHDSLREDLINNKEPESYDLIKGTIEAGAFAGSARPRPLAHGGLR